MNRERKFRAWLKDKKKMVEVEEIDFLLQKQIAYDEIEYRYTDKQPFHYTQLVDFDEIELLEYTGLRDKNGVEIFEGDIVKHFYEYENNDEIFETEELLIIEYQKEWSQYILSKANDKDGNWYGFYEVDLDYLEVIGNIYENKELLENEKED